MTTVELLQQVGLNKYEAEAYYTLLAEGPLTGYELGKRSQVPLSRSYEILERLVKRGLALMQPGDPPHYVAEEARRFLERFQENMSETLDALGGALTGLPRQDVAGEFWVLRSRQPILDRARALIESAQQEIAVRLPPEFASDLADALARAGARGCQVYQPQAARAP